MSILSLAVRYQNSAAAAHKLFNANAKAFFQLLEEVDQRRRPAVDCAVEAIFLIEHQQLIYALMLGMCLISVKKHGHLVDKERQPTNIAALVE